MTQEGKESQPVMSAEEIQKEAIKIFGSCPIQEFDVHLHSRNDLIKFAKEINKNLISENNGMVDMLKNCAEHGDYWKHQNKILQSELQKSEISEGIYKIKNLRQSKIIEERDRRIMKLEGLLEERSARVDYLETRKEEMQEHMDNYLKQVTAIQSQSDSRKEAIDELQKRADKLAEQVKAHIEVWELSKKGFMSKALSEYNQGNGGQGE